MIMLFELAGLIFVVIILRAWHSYVDEQLRYRKAASQHGCQPPKAYPNLDLFLGMDLFFRIRMADFRGQRSIFYRDMHRSMGGTFQMKSCGVTEIQTADPENIQAIAATNFSDWGVGPMRGNIGAPFLDRGIFTDDGDFWKHSRALVKPTFNRAEVADLPSFENHVQRFMGHIPKNGETFDMLQLAKRLFLDTSTEFIFGQSVESLETETPIEADRFLKAFDRALLNLALRLITGPFQFLLSLDPGYRPAYTVVHEFVDKNVRKALASRAQAEKPAEKPKTPEAAQPSKYILLDGMTQQIHDPLALRAQIINVFFPARDTAAIAFSNCIWELAHHPAAYTSLRAEAMALGDTPLTFEVIKAQPFTKAVLNETLRLHLPSSRIGRSALRDTVLPVGGGRDGRAPLFVPKGRVAEMDLYSLHRDKAIWGKDADEWKPGRWATGRPLWEAKWQYAPFLGGVRMCPAQNMVLIQVAYLLVRVARVYVKLEFRDVEGLFEEEIKLTVESRRGVKVGLERAVK